MPSPPIVTGVSPKDGTPGTKVTIRGENLGTGQNDLLGVFVCGKNCILTAEWKSASKIICRTSMGIGKGEIIIVTRKGGQGTCTVHFTGLPARKVGPLEESAVWVDESEYVDQRLDRNQKPVALSMRSDPLGLVPDDSESKAPSNMNLNEMFVNGSPDPTDENFVPAWFLIDKHFTTSFKKLKEGHTYMKRRANKNTNNAPLNHVKDSLPVFFEVQEMLSTIHHRMLKDEAVRNNKNITNNLESIMGEASQKANVLFTTVLNSKDRADSIRNTLNVIQRFKFLFYLPLNIEKNIKKGDYGIVINDYEKAKSLFSDTSVKVFRMIYEEVRSQIEEFKIKLREDLLKLPTPLSQQKQLIRHLLVLQEEGDPAWDCLSNQHEWIQNQMLQCKTKYLEILNKNKEKSTEEQAEIPREYLAEISQLALSQIPEHWYLWQQYATGVILSETGEKTKEVERLKQCAGKHTKQIKGLLRDTIILFVNLIRATFLPATLDVDETSEEDMAERESYGMWPPLACPPESLVKCVHNIRTVLAALSSLKLPDGTLQSLQELIHDMRVLCLSNFLQQTTSSVQSVLEEEDWVVDRNGHTKILQKYERLVNNLLDSLKDVLTSNPGEEELFTRGIVQQRISNFAAGIFTSFVTCLDQLAFSKSADASMPDTTKLIIVLSNLRTTEATVNPEMIAKFNTLKFPGMDQISAVTAQYCSELHQKLFESYVEQKFDAIVAALEPAMYSGYFDWSECLRPTGVRPYIKSALTGAVHVHAEVYEINPDLVSIMLCALVDHLSAEILRLLQCVPKFSANGALQARLEVTTLQQSLALFESDESKVNFQSALQLLPQLVSGAEKKLLEELANRFRGKMLFHLRCLR